MCVCVNIYIYIFFDFFPTPAICKPKITLFNGGGGIIWHQPQTSCTNLAIQFDPPKKNASERMGETLFFLATF